MHFYVELFVILGNALNGEGVQIDEALLLLIDYHLLSIDELLQRLNVVIEVLYGFRLFMLILESDLLQDENARVERLSVLVGLLQ